MTLVKSHLIEDIIAFEPPKRTLMGPGPSDVPRRILKAMAKPTIGHLDPRFIEMMDEMKALLQYAFQTQNEMTLAVSGPGSAGMEMCFVNLVSPGDKVIVCINGVFGGRMKENVERCGGIPVVIEDSWGNPVDENKVEETLIANPDAKIVAFVHAETSTGARSDAEAIAKLAHQHNCLTIVDTVTSLGGIPLWVDKWELDAVYSGSQKCLSCTPGLSPVTFNRAAVDVIKSRSEKVQSWFLDLNLVMGYWGSDQKRSYHHTAPINALYGLHEALLILKEEGLENSWNRHLKNHLNLKEQLADLGITFVVGEDFRLPQLNAVHIPEGTNDSYVRSKLLNDYNLEIGSGLGPFAGKIWRIGLMGHASRQENIDRLIGALREIL